jgi:hypothetical protein
MTFFFDVIYVEPMNMFNNELFYEALAHFVLNRIQPWPIHISIGVMTANAESNIIALVEGSPICVFFKTLGRGYDGLKVTLHIVDGWEDPAAFQFEGSDRLDAVCSYYAALQDFLRERDWVSLSGLTFGEGFGGPKKMALLGLPIHDDLAAVLRTRIVRALAMRCIDIDGDKLLIGASPGGAAGIDEWYRQLYHWDCADPRGNLWENHENDPEALFRAIMGNDRARKAIRDEDTMWLRGNNTWAFHMSGVSQNELTHRVLMFAFDVPGQTRLATWSFEGLLKFCAFINSQGDNRRTAWYLGFSPPDLRGAVRARNRWFILDQFGPMFGPVDTARGGYMRIAPDEYRCIADGATYRVEAFSLERMQDILSADVQFPEMDAPAVPTPPRAVGAPSAAQGGESESKSSSDSNETGLCFSADMAGGAGMAAFYEMFGPVGTTRGQVTRISRHQFAYHQNTLNVADFDRNDLRAISGCDATAATFPGLFGSVGTRRGRYVRTGLDSYVKYTFAEDFSLENRIDMLAENPPIGPDIGLLCMLRDDPNNPDLYRKLLEANPGKFQLIVHRSSLVQPDHKLPFSTPESPYGEIIIPRVDGSNDARYKYSMVKVMLRLLRRGLDISSLQYFIFASESCCPITLDYLARLITHSCNYTKSIYKVKDDNKRAKFLNGLMVSGMRICAKKHSQWMGLSRRDATLLCLLEAEMDRLNQEVIAARASANPPQGEPQNWTPDEHLFGSILQAFNSHSDHVDADLTWADWSDENADSPRLFEGLTLAAFEDLKVAAVPHPEASPTLHVRKIGTLI